MTTIVWYGFLVVTAVCFGLAVGFAIGSLHRRRRGLPIDPGIVLLAVICALVGLFAAGAAALMGSGS